MYGSLWKEELSPQWKILAVYVSPWKNVLFCWTKWRRSLICGWNSCPCLKLCLISYVFILYLFFLKGSSLIAHNREDRGLVRQKSSYFQTDVEYEATLDQISALVDISSHCQQYLSYECHKSVFFWYGGNNPFQHVAFWKYGTSTPLQLWWGWYRTSGMSMWSHWK